MGFDVSIGGEWERGGGDSSSFTAALDESEKEMADQSSASNSLLFFLSTRSTDRAFRSLAVVLLQCRRRRLCFSLPNFGGYSGT